MALLHIYFALRKQQFFHRLLNHGPGKQAAVSTSGKSWKRPAPLSSGIALEINAIDALGRTVLHLACTSTEPSSVRPDPPCPPSKQCQRSAQGESLDSIA